MSPVGTIQKYVGRNTEKTIVLLNKYFACKILVVLTDNSNSKIIIILDMILHYFLCIISSLQWNSNTNHYQVIYSLNASLKLALLFASPNSLVPIMYLATSYLVFFSMLFINMRKSTDAKVVVLSFLARTGWFLTLRISWFLTWVQVRAYTALHCLVYFKATVFYPFVINPFRKI